MVHRVITLLFALVGFGGVVAAAEPPPAWLVAPNDPQLGTQRPPSYFEKHAARVERNLHILNPGFTLADARSRDQLRLPGATPGNPTSTMAGIGLFSFAVVGSAHTPSWLRFAFDRGLHLGPAVFDGGGMGAGLGGGL